MPLAKEITAEIDAFVEYYWNRMKVEPPIERLKSEFPTVSDRALTEQLRKSLDKLLAKGYSVERKNYLSPKQLALANSLLNLADRRSTKKKLEDLEVSAAVYANWKKDSVFAGYLRERSEELLPDGLADAHLALVDSASSGDISAIKLLYEVTGRHTPGSQQVQNIKSMLTAVIESVQKHVRDPAILQAIATDIQLASGGLMTEPVRGELT